MFGSYRNRVSSRRRRKKRADKQVDTIRMGWRIEEEAGVFAMRCRTSKQFKLNDR